MMVIIDTGDPRAVAAVAAIHAGDTARLRQLLAEHPEMATAALGTEGGNGMTRSLLHVATDWPGHYPNVADTIALLVAAGADVHARFTGPHTETPVHWAASNDDVAALDALLDAGADIEATGAVIAAGTPLDDAVAFGQWQTARRLVDRGAHTHVFNAAGLGLLDRVRAHLAAEPSADDVTRALWASCHGGQLATAQYLLGCGADRNWIAPWDGLTPLDAPRRHGFDVAAGITYNAARLGLTPDYVGAFLPGQILAGAGIGLSMPAFTAVAVAAVAPARFATAIGISAMFRQVGAALGVAAFVAIVATPTPATAIDAYRHGWVFMATAATVGALLMLAARFAPTSS